MLYFSLSLDCLHNHLQLISLCHWWKSAAGESLRNNLHCWGGHTAAPLSFWGNVWILLANWNTLVLMETHTLPFWYCLKKCWKHRGHGRGAAHHFHNVSLWLSWQMWTQRLFCMSVSFAEHTFTCTCEIQMLGTSRTHTHPCTVCWGHLHYRAHSGI